MPNKQYIVLVTNPDYHDEPICEGAFSNRDRAVGHRRQRISAQVEEEVARHGLKPIHRDDPMWEQDSINLYDGYSWIIKEITFYE